MNTIKKGYMPFVAVACYAVFLGGCVVRTYSVAKDRIDQDVSGNQGYLTGSAPADAQQPKKFTTRTTKVVEIELRSPIKFERLKEPPEPVSGQPEPMGMRQSEQDLGSIEAKTSFSQESEFQPSTANYEPYVVQKDDTLQKISEKAYGTTKKWMKIFEANKETLKSPDKIRPGQEIRIPRD